MHGLDLVEVCVRCLWYVWKVLVLCTGGHMIPSIFVVVFMHAIFLVVYVYIYVHAYLYIYMVQALDVSFF